MISKAITASLAIAAAIMISGPASAATRQSAPHSQRHEQVTRPAKQTIATDANTISAERAMTGALNRRDIVSVGPQASVERIRIRDIAMAPVG